MKKFLSQRKKKTILTALILGLGFGVSGYAYAANASEFETPEYFAGHGLDVVNAAEAYAKGYTGKGVTVGVSDYPVNFTSPEFDTKQHSYTTHFPVYVDADGKEYTVADRDYWQYSFHGTFVAGVAAASLNNAGMHGVAFDAEVLSSPPFNTASPSGFIEDEDWLDSFTDDPNVRLVNHSWGYDYYATELFDRYNLSSMADYMRFYEPKMRLEGLSASRDLLISTAAGNDGYVMPLLDCTSHWAEGKNTPTHVISVSGLEDLDFIKRAGSKITGNNIIYWNSNLASFNEDGTIAAPSANIVSANANYTADGSIDRQGSGTSAATPFVSGAAALVHQAFPYMNAKQLGDVLLSTANPNVTSASGYTATVQRGNTKCLNILYFDGKRRTVEQQKQDCLDYLHGILTEEQFADYANYPVNAYYNVPMGAVIGQGILDVGKAVDGPGALNARRLEKRDISNEFTVKGKTAKQTLYTVDTKGYDSTWANDIKEVRVGLLAADSTEDLKKRYHYYKTNWLDRNRYDSGEPVVGAGFVKAYIDFYNSNANASGLVNLPVGLLKTGKGRLSLTGNNTYKGASIAKQGTLSIDGSVAGDAYSIDKGTIAGRGTINGTLYNKNIAVAGDARGKGNMTMNRLISRGVLLTNYHNGTNTQFIVKGEAKVNGSTVPVPLGAIPMPDDRYTVVKAAKIKSAISFAETEYELSGMLSAKNEIEGGNLSVVVKSSNNLNGADAVQNETFDAMTAMYRNLKRNNDPRMYEMRALFNMDAASARKSLSSISSNAAAKIMAAVQRSNLTQHILSSRINEAFTAKPEKVKIPVEHLDDSDDDGLEVNMNLLQPAANDIWLKFGKNWGDVRGDTDYHSTAALLGWDKAIAPNWRTGVFAGYGQTSFADNTSSDKLKDIRFGLYAGYNKAGRECLAYLDYGWMRNKLHRGITGMGLTARADYHSRILELGAEYLYDLHASKNLPWHVRPYVNAQLSRLWQNGYSEDGAGVFNQIVNSKHNNYFGMGVGVELKRYLAGGSYAVRTGVKHAFAGAEPRLGYSYIGDQTNTYDMRNVQDRTHFVLSIGGEVEVVRGWSVGGDATWQRGRHDKDWSCAVTIKRMW